MKDSTKAYLLVVLFFMPYFPGSTFRPDHLYGIACIALLFAYFAAHGRTQGRLVGSERAIIGLTLIAFAWSIARLLVDADFPLQLTNYLTCFLVGVAVWHTHRNLIIRRANDIIFAVTLFSIPVNLYAIFQYAYPDHELTKLLLKIYNGPGHANYDVGMLLGDQYIGFQTIAAGEVLGGTSMTSIFTGKHSLATFSLFSLALAIGVATDASYRTGRRSYLYVIALAAAIAGGILSTSKVFVLGAPIYFVGLALFYLRMKRASYALGILVVLVAAIIGASLMSDRFYVLGNILEAVSSGNVDRLFESRYGAQGYLTEHSQVFQDPLVWLVGMGAEAGSAKISDSQFRSIVLIGGIPYFLAFFAVPVYLLHAMWRARRLSMLAVSFFCLGIAYFAASTGIEVYWQARTIPLWMLVNLVIMHRTAQSTLAVPHSRSRATNLAAPRLAE